MVNAEQVDFRFNIIQFVQGAGDLRRGGATFVSPGRVLHQSLKGSYQIRNQLGKANFTCHLRRFGHDKVRAVLKKSPNLSGSARPSGFITESAQPVEGLFNWIRFTQRSTQQLGFSQRSILVSPRESV